MSSDFAAIAAIRSRSLSIGLAGSACIALLIAKLLLIWRININWDEFYFLSHIHALARGDLNQPFQTAYTYLFAWLPHLGHDEIEQILIARIAMFVLMAISAVLLWQLTSHWTSPQAAAIAPLCYLASSPVLRHGAAFRADSLLAPLILGMLILLSTRPANRKTDYLAGVCAGIAFTVSVKAILIAPLVLAAVLLEPMATNRCWRSRLENATGRLARFSISAIGIAGPLLLISWLVLPIAPEQTAGSFAAHASSKTLLEGHLIPQLTSLQATLAADWLIWGLMCGGLVVSLLRRNFLVTSSGLSLLPILFYRNSFPYYYIVMLLPAVMLAAAFFDGTRQFLQNRVSRAVGKFVPAGLLCGICLVAAINLRPLLNDDIERQRSVVSAVHEIFPIAVPYIDRGGMISSFPKVNFFMSSWGIENYRAAGKPFMPEALERHRPPLLLSSIPEPGLLDFQTLLPEDLRLISESYVHYWGPIYVAGTRASLTVDAIATANLPFPGHYRLEAACPVIIDGISREPGYVLNVTDANSRVTMRTGPCHSAVNEASLVWSKAQPAPHRHPPTRSMYLPL